MAWQSKLDLYFNQKWERLILLGILILYSSLLAYHINAPFIGTNEAYNGMYGIAAWNWLHGGATKIWFTNQTPYGAQIALPEVTKDFFISHPQFFITPAALSYWIFGIGEWQTRLGPIIFSLLGLVLFWSLLKRVFRSPTLTILGSLFYIFFPMGIYYGRMLTNEPITMFFVLLLIWSLIAFAQEQKKKYLVILLASAFLGGLMDWEFVFAVVGSWLYIAIKKEYPERIKLLFLMPTLLAASIGVLLFQIWKISNHANPISFLFAMFMKDSGRDLLRFIIFRSSFDLTGYSEIGLILAAIGLISYISIYKKDKEKILFAALLACTGILTYVIFMNTATAHQFIGFYFIPPIALMAGWALYRIHSLKIVVILLTLFVFSSLLYAGKLFSYKSFAEDDFVMLKRTNISVPLSEHICMGDNGVNTNIKFYLFPHAIDDFPCPKNDSYFVLRQPLSYVTKDPHSSLLQTFFNNGFWSNLKWVSLAGASGIELVKSVPFLKRVAEEKLAQYDPHKSYPAIAQRIQELIDKNKLKPIDCSTNFCLYKK